MNKVNTYNCFSENGAVELPHAPFINQCLQQGMKPVVFLDSCICLHIIKVVDYGRSAKNVDLKKIISLKEYMENHSDISISPYFGFMELCSREHVFDTKKLQDFKYRMDFFIQIPLKDFKKFKYNFHRDFYIFTNAFHPPKNLPDELQTIFKTSYCALLKIRSLAMQGVSKNSAERSILEFINWMMNDLDMARGHEYKLALNIFGGNTKFWKMIGFNSKQSDVKKIIMGTCWDFFHSRYTTRRFEVSKILRESIQPYLLTSDGNLSDILKDFSLTIVKDGGDHFRSSFILNSSSTFPHFEDSFLDKQSEKMQAHFINRYNKERFFDEKKVDKLINGLELENGIL